MSAPFGSDPWLDARLRNVPLPVGMLARLNQLAKETADGANAENGPKLYRPNQPIPLGPGLSDEQMDAALMDVPLPSGLRQRLERIALEPQRRLTGRYLAIAASFLVAVGIAYLSRSALFPSSHNPEPGKDPAFAGAESGDALELATKPLDSVDGNESVALDAIPGNDLDSESAIDDLRWQLVDELNDQFTRPDDFASRSPPDFGPLPRPNKRSVFAVPDRTFDSLPELEVVGPTDAPRGIAPPTAPGYDLRFRAKHGQNPFVVPAAHKDLQSLRVPLVTGSTSYQNAWQALADRRLLAPDEVRIEEFLAAVDYEFPPATPGSLALRAAAGPSPFAEPGTRLLQVGVQAGALVPQNRVGVALTVVVDTSASMRRGGRLGMVRRALADVALRLDNADRISLIANSDQARFLVEAAGRDKLNRILSAIQSLEPEQATNMGAGLEAAYAAAIEPSPAPGEVRRVVLITDGLADVSDDILKRIEALVAEGTGKNIALQVISVGGISAERDTASLERIAAAARSKVLKVADVDATRYALLELLTDRNQVVAREASLRITFNPEAVAAYRLLGHETVTLTGSTVAPSTIDLRADEVATALVELRLNSHGGDDVAFIELSWHDAASGEQRSVKQRVSRLQFAKSFAESPLALQSAAIVAHAAELLRGSYFAAGSKSLGPVLDLAGQTSPLVTDRPSMRAFLSFVQQAEKVRLRGTKR